MKNEVSYWLMDPTGNITILVETPVPGASFPSVAEKLMQLEPEAEQVGFLSCTPPSGPNRKPQYALCMAGGEFCGNASMSAAVYFATQEKISSGSLDLTVSGAEKPVTVTVCAGPDNTWSGTVHMPAPRQIRAVPFPDGQTRPVVFFDGIAHVIMEPLLPASLSENAEKLAKDWCSLLKTDALGLMFFDTEPTYTPGTRSAEADLRPLVYVPAADTLFWESSCASGTTAAGAWLAEKLPPPFTLTLRQPGGPLQVTASEEGELHLAGSVRVIKKQTISICPPRRQGIAR